MTRVHITYVQICILSNTLCLPIVSFIFVSHRPFISFGLPLFSKYLSFFSYHSFSFCKRSCLHCPNLQSSELLLPLCGTVCYCLCVALFATASVWHCLLLPVCGTVCYCLCVVQFATASVWHSLLLPLCGTVCYCLCVALFATASVWHSLLLPLCGTVCYCLCVAQFQLTR